MSTTVDELMRLIADGATTLSELRKALTAALEAQPAEPFGYMRHDEILKVKNQAYLCRVTPALFRKSDMVPVYARPPCVAVPDDRYVTRVSAEAAINYLSLSNSAGRERDAMAMLDATPISTGSRS